MMITADIPVVPWLEAAAYAAAHIQSFEAGNHYLYVVLLSGYATSGGARVYGDETSSPPEQRYWQHRSGHNSAQRLPSRGRGLLPSLYDQLNPLSQREADMLEPVLAAALNTVRWEGRPIEVRCGSRRT